MFIEANSDNSYKLICYSDPKHHPKNVKYMSMSDLGNVWIYILKYFRVLKYHGCTNVWGNLGTNIQIPKAFSWVTINVLY